jgi:ssRNA-specific RNase YbeY (16S rRNA maturation enzyme)
MNYGDKMAKKMQLIILVSDEAIKDLKKKQINAKSYQTVVMSLMKNADFKLKRLGDFDPSQFEDLNMNKAFADIETKEETEEIEEPEIETPEQTSLEAAVKRASWGVRR